MYRRIRTIWYKRMTIEKEQFDMRDDVQKDKNDLVEENDNRERTLR